MYVVSNVVSRSLFHVRLLLADYRKCKVRCSPSIRTPPPLQCRLNDACDAYATGGFRNRSAVLHVWFTCRPKGSCGPYNGSVCEQWMPAGRSVFAEQSSEALVLSALKGLEPVASQRCRRALQQLFCHTAFPVCDQTQEADATAATPPPPPLSQRPLCR